ncbi:MAG: hypothetical protein K2N78_10915, partial [Oscillospiraceae bacterium]|nr:hypothetical protein [Oscillospiraceae bacterium]
MKRHLTAIGAALLTLCMLLTACGGKQKGGGEPADSSGSGIYTSDVLPLDLPLTDLTASGAGGGSLYLAGMEEDEIEADGELEEDGEFSSSFTFSSTASDDDGFSFYSGMGHAALYRVDAATGGAVKLEGYAAAEDGASVKAVVPCPDGSLWVLEQSGGLDLDSVTGTGLVSVDIGGLTAAGGGVWRHLSADGGQELGRVDMTDLARKLGVENITDTRMDASGRLYAASGSTVTALDSGLAVLFTCKCPETVERLTALADGGVGAVTDSGGGRTLYPIDPEAGTLGAACPLTGSVRDIYAGDAGNSFLYRSGDSLYGWPKGADSPRKLLSWSGAGVDSGQVAALTFLEDGQGAALLRDGGGWPVAYSLARLVPADGEALAGRTVLTLATLGMSSETRTRVLEFNRTNSQYRIEVRDYSEYNTADDASAGLTRLNTEILAGNMPDLLEVSGALPLRQYAARGMIEDLWPFIEGDPDLGRDGVMERVLEADETGGKLCRVFSRFTIETAAGAPSVVGDGQSWTLEELKAALDKMPEGCCVMGSGETKNSILEGMFSDSLDRFVDWDAGTASFDSPEFQAILEFCDTFPAQARETGEDTDAYTRVAQGGQLLLPVYLNDLASPQIYRALFGGEAAFVGYPNEAGSGVSFSVDGGIAMSSACKDKDGAWSFLRQALLPGDVKLSMEFPVNRADFQRKAQESMEVTYLK